MRKVLYVSGSRADYGLMRNSLDRIQDHVGLELIVCATGMHLMKEHGNTIDDIIADGREIVQVDAVIEADSSESTARFISEFIDKFTDIVKKVKPNVILLLGDRAEMLGAAIVGSCLGIPVAHIHGGDVSSTIDEITRHAITKLSHLHLAATEKSAQRIQKMGEDNWRITVVGAPGLDRIFREKRMDKQLVEKKLGFHINRPFVIVLQHPVTGQEAESGKQMRSTLEAVKALGYDAVVVYPNADPGNKEMIEVIKEYSEDFHILPNLGHGLFIDLASHADAIVGNSSCAIIEAPSLKLPAVNIGLRQEGREQADNVINTGYDKDKIMDALKKAVTEDFQKGIRSSPYGDGTAGKKIAEILAKVRINKDLIQKHLSY